VRLELERSGGFAGRTVRWSMDTDGLDPDGRAEVQELLAQAPGWSGGDGVDRFSYRLVADRQDDEPLEVSFGDPLPPPAQRLLALVRASPPG
jgi:hypothetical protein